MHPGFVALLVIGLIVGYGAMIGLTVGVCVRLRRGGVLSNDPYDETEIVNFIVATLWPIALPALLAYVLATESKAERRDRRIKELERQLREPLNPPSSGARW